MKIYVQVVADALAGFLAVRGDRLALHAEHRVVYRRDIARVRDEQVTLISGGGSGHEVRLRLRFLWRYLPRLGYLVECGRGAD